MLTELSLFVRLVGIYFFVHASAAMLLLAVGLRQFEAFGFFFWLPVFDRHSVVTTLFERVTHDLVPLGATLVAGTPFSAFSVQVTLAFGMAFLLLLPFSLFGLFLYLKPILDARGRQWLAALSTTSTLLFAGGALFGYLVIVPRMLAALSYQADLLGVPQYIFLQDFIQIVGLMLFVSGCIFLLPLVMPILSRVGLVSAPFWRAHWRIFFVVSLLVTALLTNDGTGVTMFLLSLPLIACYGFGMGISTLVERFEKKSI